MVKIPKNMYQDCIKRWNIIVGCLYSCNYCYPSFRRQMKRQKPTIDKNGKDRGCEKCYRYLPHFHEERLKQPLPRTKGDGFIWICSSGDISFAKSKWMEKILERVKELSNRTFFFQTKNPIVFNKYDFPKNCLLGITLETNRNRGYSFISNAPLPSKRFKDFLSVDFDRKVVTIEPILQFDHDIFVMNIKKLNPERVYIGYNTKNTELPEPSLFKTRYLCNELKQFTKVKLKHIKKEMVSIDKWK